MEILVGTSAFTADGWPGSFYPKGMKPADFLTYYSTKFNVVELDNTFYRIPPLSMVEGWNNKTPNGFTFAAKVPRTITHDKVLVDCEDELRYFLNAMDNLGDKLGPLLFQFGYFNAKQFKTQADFHAVSGAILKEVADGLPVRRRDSQQELDERAVHRLAS